MHRIKCKTLSFTLQMPRLNTLKADLIPVSERNRVPDEQEVGVSVFSATFMTLLHFCHPGVNLIGC